MTEPSATGKGCQPRTDAAGDNHRQRLQDGQECLAAALDYLALGWCPLSLCPPDHVGVGRNHQCDSPGKRPWHSWKEFQDRRPTEDEVQDWWKKQPGANVGIALGPVSGLIRVDVEGVAGEEALQRKSNGDLPPTLEFRSGRKDGTGRGLLYRIPDGVQLRTTAEPIAAGQELRFQAKGAQTVLPPSRHRDGGRYEWVVGHAPDDIEPALAPAWLIRDLEPVSTNGTSKPLALANGEAIHEGSRNDTLTSLAGTMRRRGFGAEAIYQALLVENGTRCDPPLSEREVRGIAESVARYPPAESKDGGPLTGLDIILAYFWSKYQPVFRRENVIRSGSLGRDVSKTEACQGAGKELVEQLALAVDAPRHPGGVVKLGSLQRFFRDWAPGAWVELLDQLDEEESADEVDDSATEDFAALVKAALLKPVSLGHVYEDHNAKDRETRVEQRSLVDWCILFAKPGKWSGVRSYKIWTYRDPVANKVRIALRVELFGQINQPGLSRIKARKFTELCRRYEVGTPLGEEKPCGYRATELLPGFLDNLTAGPEMAVSERPSAPQTCRERNVHLETSRLSDG